MTHSLTHIDEQGQARMVDIGDKQNTLRIASAQAVVTMKGDTLSAILAGEVKKGDVFSCARIAAIMAVKRTPDLIPLCHTIPIDGVDAELHPRGADQVVITVTVRTTWHTGVEMEALTGASAAALTIYDMCKAMDRAMEIGPVRLLHKSGGKSGDFVRERSHA